MIGTAQFQMMKRTAVLINTARGPLVDQKALADGPEGRHDLRRRPGRDRPGAAAAWTIRCCQLPNVVIAPHIASATVQTRNQMAEICAKQSDRGRDGPKAAGVGEPGGGGEATVIGTK